MVSPFFTPSCEELLGTLFHRTIFREASYPACQDTPLDLSRTSRISRSSSSPSYVVSPSSNFSPLLLRTREEESYEKNFAQLRSLFEASRVVRESGSQQPSRGARGGQLVDTSPPAAATASPKGGGLSTSAVSMSASMPIHRAQTTTATATNATNSSSAPFTSGARSQKPANRTRNMLPCEVCGKAFDRPSLLRRHMRTHTGEKPHVCDVCDKGFSTSSSLNTHRRIHSGEKPHECPICGKRFTASSNLYYHRMTHSKEKPHKCDLCGKSFPTPGDLKAHTYIHSGQWPYKCDICNRGFSKQTNLRNHLSLHTGDKPFECEMCQKKFALACNLRAHIKTHMGTSVSSDMDQSSLLV